MDITIPKIIGTSSFSRSTIGSYIDSLGTMRYAAANVFRMSYDPLNLSAAALPLLEGGMNNSGMSFTEELQRTFAFAGLNQTYGNGKAPDGTYTANAYLETTANSTHELVKVISVGGAISTFSIFAKLHDATRTSIQLFVDIGASQTRTTNFDISTGTITEISNTIVASGSASSMVDYGNGWYRIIITTPGGGGTLRIRLLNGTSNTYAGTDNVGMYLWGAQYESGTVATSYTPSTQTFTSRTGSRFYVNSVGNLVTSASAVVSYTPENLTLAPKLQLQPATTNLALRSIAFNNATWVKTSCSVTSTTDVSPDNSSNGSIITSTATGVVASTIQTLTVPNDSLFRVFSVYIKKTSGATTFPGMTIAYTGGGGIACSASINTDTGVVIAGDPAFGAAPSYINVRSLPNFWRVTIGLANNSSGNTNCSLGIYPAVNTNAAAAWVINVVGSVSVWGAQFEVGYSETNFITTVATTATATADVASSSPLIRAADVSTFGLIYSNILENDFPVWSSAATYGVDVAGSNSVIYNHVKYASLQSSNTNHQPDTSPAWWSVIGATNKYAMFDAQVGTQTVGTVGGHIIVYVQIGSLNSLNFLNVSADSITATLYGGYSNVYSSVIDMTGGSTGVPVTDYTITGLAAYSDGYVKLDIYSATTAPAIGNFVVGTNYFLGSTETSPTIGITDYSIKTVDAFGNPTLTVRGYAKRMNTKQLLDDADVDTVARLMAQVRAKPCVWNANTTFADRTSNKKTSLIIFGYYKDWEIDVAYSTKSYLTATIEGLI